MNEVGTRFITWIEDEFEAGMLTGRQAEELRAFASYFASVDTRRMAETGNTDSVRSTGGAVVSEADETPKGHRP